jgi:hypothetical protein
LFADNVMKVNRKAKLVRRVIIITDAALYILDPTFYRLKHRYALQASSSLSLFPCLDTINYCHLINRFSGNSPLIKVLVECAGYRKTLLE